MTPTTLNCGATLSVTEAYNGIFVLDQQGKRAIELGTYDERNEVIVYDRQEKQAISLGSDESGNKAIVYDKQGKPATELVADDWGNWVRVRYALQPEFPAAQLASIGVQNFVNVYNRGDDQTAAGLFSNDFTGNLVAVYDRQTGEATALGD